MRRVSQKKYDTSYYTDNYSFDYSRRLQPKDFGDIPQRMGSLIKLDKNDTVVDFGCGAGALVFCLLLRYKCKVIGLDYSKDAIYISNKNKKAFLASHSEFEDKVNFYNKGVPNLPKYKDITAVYLQDVIEHMYDHEIEAMLKKFISWNKNGIYLIIHTDNNIYLRFIQPIIDFISIVLGKTSKRDVEKRKKYDAERHINLMTVSEIKKKLKKYGFETKKVEYSTISKQKIEWQLGRAGSVKILTEFIYYLSKLLFFLRPSFFLLAKSYNNK